MFRKLNHETGRLPLFLIRFININLKQLLIPFLIISASSLMMFATSFDSPVYNEEGRLVSGALYLKTGNYSSFRVNPPLVSLISAVPSIISGAVFPTYSDLGFSNFGREEYRAGALFIKKNPNFRFLLISGRICCIFLVILCFIPSVQYSVSLNGRSAAYFLVCLMIFSPFFLGHGHLISPDAAAGFFALLFIYFFHSWLRNLDYRSVFIAGVTLGLAELTKFTLLILYPVTLTEWILYRFSKIGISSPVPIIKQFLQLLVLFMLSLFVINLGYMFEGTGTPLRDYRFQSNLFTGSQSHKDTPIGGGNRFNSSSATRVEMVLGYLPIPLPKNFIQGIDTQRLDFETGMPSYLRGKWSDHGWWYYYLYALLLKNPLGTIGLFLLATFCTLFLKGYNADWRDEAVVLLPGITILGFVSSQTGFSIHSRYAIPALPFFFLWSTKVARAFKPTMKVKYPKSTRAVRWIAVILLVWSVGSSLWIYPHSIAYFNELAAVLPTHENQHHPFLKSQVPLAPLQKVLRFPDAGPLNGPRHLLGSDVDWGQNLYRLQRWCNEHPEVQGNITIDCNCLWFEREMMTQSKQQRNNKREPHWFAVSVNRLYGENQEYCCFFDFAPESIIGYTIYVYHLSPEVLERAGCHISQKGVTR